MAGRAIAQGDREGCPGHPRLESECKEEVDARAEPGHDEVGARVPTVLRWGPYRAFFYSNESDEPAHVHVRAGSKEAKFWLHDLTVAVNARFPAHELGDIMRHLKSHRVELQAAWDEHFGD